MSLVRLCGALLIGLGLAGCHLKQEPNPNDPNQVSGDRQAFVIRDYMKQLSDTVEAHKTAGDFTGPNGSNPTLAEVDEQGAAVVTKAAKEYMDRIHFKTIPKNEESLVAQGYITAHEWKEAKARLDIALTVDSSAESLVNDRLRYARCLANLGDADGAIAMARASFAAPPTSKWPILYSVYLEIVPAALLADPSAKVKLAQLIEDAIDQHKQATRDLTLTDQDQIFHQEQVVAARPHHISKAWTLAIKLYTDAKRPDLVKQAEAKRDSTKKQPASVQV